MTVVDRRRRLASGRTDRGSGRVASGAGGLLLCAVLIGCGASGGAPGQGSGGAKVEPLPTARAESRDFSRSLPWFGRVESRHAVTVVALQAGRITRIQAADGDEVERGEPLFRLGGPAAARRRAALEKKVQSLAERVRAAAETVELRRSALGEQLVRRDEVLAAEAELVRLKEELAAARQDLAVLASALDLRSPARGTFTGRRVAVGQDVTAGDTLAEVVDAGSLRVVASLYPTRGAELDGAPVALDGGQGAGQATAPARIVRVLPDRTDMGATTVWIEGGPLEAGRGGAWAPGETVSGTLRLAEHRGAVAVPEEAVVRDERDRPFVFVPEPGSGADGKTVTYRKRAVTTGLSADGWVEVTSGLTTGTEVVTEGAYELLFGDFGTTYRVPD